MKIFNKERTYVVLFVLIIVLIPNFYFLTFVILTMTGLIKPEENYTIFELLIYINLLVFFTNNMLHIIMESNFQIKEHDGYFGYKTLMRRKEKIYNNGIKKIVFCKENLFLKGDYEVITIVRKGLKRSLFFHEYSMKKQDYTKLKEIFLSKDVKVIYKKSKLFKPLATLFYF
ncbi:hypothetical protein KHQ88_06010 [Mycoplasmatota bacterium]|nr:hypothetical protein KHQ88_06010 [Mycoplasmatota bacterium]